MQSTASQEWDKCLEIIKGMIPEAQFSHWFGSLTFVSCKGDELVIACPSEFFASQLDTRFMSFIKFAMDRVYGPERSGRMQLVYNFPIVQGDPAAVVNIDSARPSTAVRPAPGASANPFQDKYVEEINSQLNPEYNFENYCISDSNKVAQSIGEAIANDPKLKTFNPLFVFGSCGVGKTHLIQAIGIRIKERDPRTRVLYITSRLFQDQFSSATLRGKINEFIKFYQSIDTLIIDDVQELIGKEKTQRTFFHIFNHLKQNNKQIIMSSDCAPADMEGLEERLLSRFKSGMTAQLEKPDSELRRKVLIQKSRRDGLYLSEDVIDYIVTNVTQSIREIEGVMVSLLAYATTLNCEIDINLARRVLSNSVKLNQHKTSFESITNAVTEYYGLEPGAIFEKSRKREISDARQMVMYLAKKHTKMPFKAIGSRLQKSHATVLYACRLIDQRLPIEKKLQEDLSQIERNIMGE